jgi:hypothetical protein
LKATHVRIIVREDELVWKHAEHGTYTPKLGYIHLNFDFLQRDPKWWWKGLWKSRFPLDIQIFISCILGNKISTWDRMKKRKIEGPGWCSLCRNEEEIMAHLFLSCPFTLWVWKEFSSFSNLNCSWRGISIEEVWRNWSSGASKKTLRDLPLIVCYGVWLARNATIFQNRMVSP